MKKYRIKLIEPFVNLSLLLRRKGFTFNFIFITFLVTGLMFFLGYNIYSTVKQAEKTFRAKELAQEKRDQLLEESRSLDQKLAYIESAEGKRTLAIEGYKYADPGESLYKIERESDDIIYIEEEVFEPVNLNDNVYWWKFLLGVN